MNEPSRILLAAMVALLFLGAISQYAPEQSASDTEIRIGNLMPYTGALAAYAAIGKTEAAFFDMINDRGGINGRKVRFISYDDNSDPTTALDLTRALVERDNVLLMFGSFGTPGNLAVQSFLNERKIPQLFVASGDEALSNPKAFPWTMGWQPSFRAEGRVYANYIQAFYPQRKIVVLWQNDQFGRDLFKGIRRKDSAISGPHDHRRYRLRNFRCGYLDTHVSILKRSGADDFVLAGVRMTLPR